MSAPKHSLKQLIWTSHSHVQSTLHIHTLRHCSWFPKKFMVPLTPLDGINPQPSPSGNPRPFQISLGILPRPFQLWRHITRTPICNIIAYKKTGTRNLWDFHGTAGWNLGVALQHYRCHTIVSKSTKTAQVSDTVEFRQHHLTLPKITPMDRIVHGVNTLTCALQDAPSIACNNQLAVIQALRQAIKLWAHPKLPFVEVPKVTTPPPTNTQRRSILGPMRRLTNVKPQDLLPRVVIHKPNASTSAPKIPSIKEHYKPVSQRTWSKFPYTVDSPPPMVAKATDLGPITRRTRSQNTATAKLRTRHPNDNTQPSLSKVCKCLS